MIRMLLLPLRSVTPLGFGVGVISTVAIAKLGRPLLVETVRAGIEAKNEVVGIWDRIRDSAEELAAEARASRS